MTKLRKKYKINGKNLNLEIKKEIAILKKLDHENVIKLKEVLFCEKKDEIYFIMEFIENGPILKICDFPKKNNIKNLKIKIFQIFDAIFYLHEIAKIAHFDIKQENILNVKNEKKQRGEYMKNHRGDPMNFSEKQNFENSKNQRGEYMKNHRGDYMNFSEKIKIIDFGCSIFLNSSKMVKNQISGTRGFFPPEILCKKKKLIDATKIDIYQIGLLIYYLVTGKKFFFIFENFQNEKEKKKKFLLYLKNLYFPEWIDNIFISLIKSCLQYNPDLRPSAKKILKHEFFQNKIFEKKKFYKEIILKNEDIENSVSKVISNTFFASAKMLVLGRKTKKKLSVFK